MSSTGLLGDDPRCVVSLPDDPPDFPEPAPLALDPFRRELFVGGPATRGPSGERVGSLSSRLLVEGQGPFGSGWEPPVVFGSFSAPRGIALDLPAGKVYWTQIVDDGVSFPDGQLLRANLDLSGIETLATGFATVLGVAVDRAAGKVYWSGSDTIRRANLDGSDAELFHDPSEGGVGHLVIDAIGGRLYWMDGSPGQAGRILGIGLDGDDAGVEQDGLVDAGGRNGDLLVLDRVAGQLFRVDPVRGLRRPLTHAGAFVDPRGIAILPVPAPGAVGAWIAAATLAAAARRPTSAGGPRPRRSR